MVKYVLHALPRRDGATLSCIHDANPWPADRYAGIPAPRPDERAVVWLENAHPVPIHPASAPRTAPSDTRLLLHDGAGAVIAEARLGIPASGSAVVRPDRLSAAAALARAGERGYVLVRDGTCRLFGYHGLLDEAGGRFSLDHMFGF